MHDEWPITASQLRFAWYRLLRRAKCVLGHDPLTLPVLLRLTPEGISRQITNRTELVVEGFPRAGNTFTVFALRDAARHRIKVASHVHHPAQVKAASAMGVPTVLVVREPVATLASYLTYGQHARVADVIKEYCSYHRDLVPYADDVVIGEFEECTNDLSAVIGRLNERFSLRLPPFDQSPENVDKIFEEIQRYHGLVHRKRNPINVVPRPDPQREDIAKQYRSQLTSPRYGSWLRHAQDLHSYFVDKAAQQRAAHHRSGDVHVVHDAGHDAVRGEGSPGDELPAHRPRRFDSDSGALRGSRWS